MDLNNEAGLNTEQSASAQSPIAVVPAPAGDSPMDAREAARSLAAWRRDRGQQGDASKDQPQLSARAERAAPHEPEQESSPAQAGSDAGERPAPPGETESADPAAEARPEAGTDLPPIEAPRSWTKEDKELFTSLPRATQERIAERERSREGDFNRRQQEAAEKSKALEAERSKAEQARQQYEAALPQLLQTLEQQQAGEFADIKTLADVERLAREDWPRYALWDVQQKKIAEVGQHLALAQQRQAQERVPNSENCWPGARTISSRRKSLTWRTPREPQACRPRRSRCSRNWASRKQNWRNRGTARGTCPCVTIACSS